MLHYNCRNDQHPRDRLTEPNSKARGLGAVAKTRVPCSTIYRILRNKCKSLNSTLFDDRSSSGPRASTARPDPRIGTVVDGRYQVEGVLGEGGMGLVYRATHVRLRKTLAMKVLRRGSTNDPNARIRFQREAESASAIGNAHIVDISDFGSLEDGSTYFVMEYLEGVDLIDAIEAHGPMPAERACNIAVQLCRALGAAHDAGIVHRDLKPENVFLIDRDGNPDFVKVLDFGIAKMAQGPDRLTRANDFLGTPHYMSPEQCDGRNIDQRTDIYALGVLIYEMVTARVPHDADTVMALLHKHVYERPTPPTRYVPEISADLERIILRCLEKKPECRYESMYDLQADLERFQQGRPSLGPQRGRRRPGRVGSRTSRLGLGALAVALISLLGGLAVRAFPGTALEHSARSNVERIVVVPAERGVPELLARPESAADGDQPDFAATPAPLAEPDDWQNGEGKGPRPPERAKPKARKMPRKVRRAPSPQDDEVLNPWL